MINKDMRMSSDEMLIIGELYESIYHESLVSAAVVGDSAGLEGGSVENTDSYAKGDTRIPTIIGLQRRNKINNIFDPLKHQRKSGKKKKIVKNSNKL